MQSGVNVQLIEGYFDFLSLLAIYNKELPQSDVIILNGSGQIGEAINYMQRMRYMSAQTWFDNDEGGEKALGRLKDVFKDTGLNITSQNRKYEEFNDVNEMYMELGYLARTRITPA